MLGVLIVLILGLPLGVSEGNGEGEVLWLVSSGEDEVWASA